MSELNPRLVAPFFDKYELIRTLAVSFKSQRSLAGVAGRAHRPIAGKSPRSRHGMI